jgi:hypothetical protein
MLLCNRVNFVLAKKTLIEYKKEKKKSHCSSINTVVLTLIQIISCIEKNYELFYNRVKYSSPYIWTEF